MDLERNALVSTRRCQDQVAMNMTVQITDLEKVINLEIPGDQELGILYQDLVHMMLIPSRRHSWDNFLNLQGGILLMESTLR